MIKVAIIEDEQIHLDRLISILEQYSKETSSEYEITSFSSPLVFIDSFKCDYDLIFLDIKMPGIDGMKVAHHIREIDPKVVLVFITSLAQYAIEGYSVNAVDYILKPYSYGEFKLKMNRIANKFLVEDKKYIYCQKDRAKYKIATDDVYYIETNIHQVEIHTIDDSYTRYCALGVIEKELQGLGFVKINSCYLVNLRYVSSIYRDECIMKNGALLKISRSHIKEISDLFKNN
ncbi:MAG: LytTR family DNA-binding domain-containing protein [Bacilli bacterium]|nr:LytTR family DNA-binding domain-containing protein [Bacilli bacterium]